MRMTTTVALLACCLLLSAGLGVVNAQDEKGDDEKAKKAPVGLDVKNVEVTALYLNKAIIRLELMRAEAERTGNHVKYNEQLEKHKEEMLEWNGVRVNWLLQVDTVGSPQRNALAKQSDHDHFIRLVENYAFKNKARLQVVLAIKSDQGRLGLGSNDKGFPPEDTIAFEEAWAKTLKKGDYIVVEGVLQKDGPLHGALGLSPVLYLQPIKYSKYTPPAKRK